METYVITEPCIGVKDGSCVEVCPVACIHTTPDAPQYYIDPDVCIACEQCVIVCPVEAIFLDDDVPEEWRHYSGINADFFTLNKPTTTMVTPEQAERLVESACAFAALASAAIAAVVVDANGEVIAQRAMPAVKDGSLAMAVARAEKAAKTGRRSIGGQPLLSASLMEVIGGLSVAGGGDEFDSKATIAAWESVPVG